jgi:hypothetical protein
LEEGQSKDAAKEALSRYDNPDPGLSVKVQLLLELRGRISNNEH